MTFFGTWVQKQKIVANDGDYQDHFGYSVAIWGDQAVNAEYHRIREENPGLSGSLSGKRFETAEVITSKENGSRD